MVEFTLAAPILLLILLAIFQLGLLFANMIDITSAARDGARKATISRNDPNAATTVTNTVKNALSFADKSQVGVAVTPNPAATPWVGGQSDVTVDVTYPYSYNIMGVSVWSGTLRSKATVRVE
jgi:Flp pilus assembly protein TadG